MDLATILKSAGELGILGTVAIVLLMAYREMTSKLADVVANNTQALTKLCDSTAATADGLEEHDQRAQRIEAGVTQIGRVVDRIEARITPGGQAAGGGGGR